MASESSAFGRRAVPRAPMRRAGAEACLEPGLGSASSGPVDSAMPGRAMPVAPLLVQVRALRGKSRPKAWATSPCDVRPVLRTSTAENYSRAAPPECAQPDLPSRPQPPVATPSTMHRSIPVTAPIRPASRDLTWAHTRPTLPAGSTHVGGVSTSLELVSSGVGVLRTPGLIVDKTWSGFRHAESMLDHIQRVFDQIWSVLDQIWTVFGPIWNMLDPTLGDFDHIWAGSPTFGARSTNQETSCHSGRCGPNRCVVLWTTLGRLRCAIQAPVRRFNCTRSGTTVKRRSLPLDRRVGTRCGFEPNLANAACGA